MILMTLLALMPAFLPSVAQAQSTSTKASSSPAFYSPPSFYIRTHWTDPNATRVGDHRGQHAQVEMKAEEGRVIVLSVTSSNPDFIVHARAPQYLKGRTWFPVSFQPTKDGWNYTTITAHVRGAYVGVFRTTVRGYGIGSQMSAPASSNLGVIRVGSHKWLDVPVRNLGSALILINNVTHNFGDNVKNPTPVPFHIAPGETVVYRIKVRPHYSGTRNGHITFHGNFRGSQRNVPVSYTATGPSRRLEIGPALAFGHVSLGKRPYPTKNIELRNLGNSPLTVFSASTTDSQFRTPFVGPVVIPARGKHIVKTRVIAKKTGLQSGLYIFQTNKTTGSAKHLATFVGVSGKTGSAEALASKEAKPSAGLPVMVVKAGDNVATVEIEGGDKNLFVHGFDTVPTATDLSNLGSPVRLNGTPLEMNGKHAVYLKAPHASTIRLEAK